MSDLVYKDEEHEVSANTDGFSVYNKLTGSMVWNQYEAFFAKNDHIEQLEEKLEKCREVLENRVAKGRGITVECQKCKKPKISPDERCDCRLEWQINKSFEQQEEFNTLEKKLAKTVECLGAISEYGCTGEDAREIIFLAAQTLKEIGVKNEQIRKTTKC